MLRNKVPKKMESDDFRRKMFKYVQEEIDFSKDTLESEMRIICGQLEYSPRNYFGLIRNVLTSRSATPPLFDIMEILGPRDTLSRLDNALKLFQ